MMQRTPKDFVKYFYKEIIRTQIGTNLHLIFSLRSDEKISIAQMFNFETDTHRVDQPVQGAIAVARTNLINILLAVIYVVVRLPQHEIPEKYQKFVLELNRISVESQKMFVEDIKEIGYEPKVIFRGEEYNDYHQKQEGNTKRW